MGKLGWVPSEETRRKISEALKRRKEKLGYHHSEETKAKLSAANRGVPRTLEWSQNISDGLRASEKMKCRPRPKGNCGPHPKGEKASNWRGDAVGYAGIHSWLRKTYGKPDHCDFCGGLNAKRYEWANKSKLYKRDRDDWWMLCVSCHRKHDAVPPWNKGMKMEDTSHLKGRKMPEGWKSPNAFVKGQAPMNKGKKLGRPAAHKGRKTGRVPSSAFREGHPAPETAFKKGMVPWNKGKKTGVKSSTQWPKGHTPWNKKPEE